MEESICRLGTLNTVRKWQIGISIVRSCVLLDRVNIHDNHRKDM